MDRREAFRKVKAAYKYDHAHDDASIKVIITVLAAATSNATGQMHLRRQP